MLDLRNRLRKFPKSYFLSAGILFLILLAAFLLWFNQKNSIQAVSATAAQVYFEGEYHKGNDKYTLLLHYKRMSLYTCHLYIIFLFRF